jgi:hypothetical protein
MTAPKQGELRGQASRLANARENLYRAYLASDERIKARFWETLEEDLGPNIARIFLSEKQMSVDDLLPPGKPGRIPHKHIDKFAFRLACGYHAHFYADFKVEFAPRGDPITPAARFMWLVIEQFDPDGDKRSRRIAIQRAGTALKKYIARISAK